MTFKTKDIRQDHWNKTTKYCGIPRDMVKGIKEPQGKKFLDTQIIGIPNYIRVENVNVKGGIVVRRRKSNG